MDRSAVPALTRAMTIIDLLAGAGQAGLTVTDIAARTGIAKSTTALLCSVLEHEGMVRKHDGRYRLGRRFLGLAADYLATVDDLEEFYAEVRRLPIVSREAARLALLDGTDVIYLARYEATGRPRRVTGGIGDRFPASRLTPPVGSPERAHYDQWCYFALSELEQPLWTLAKHLFALPERRRIPAVLDTARWEFAVAVKILALGLGQREFIVCDHFTAADILMAHTLAWASAFKLPLEHDHLVTYTERLLARPAWARVQKREQAERD